MGEVKIVMHLNCIYKRLISVNIVLILVFTMISTTAFADGNESLMASTNDASGEDYIIINGVKYDAREKLRGNGWSYDPDGYGGKSSLYLYGYNGGSIVYQRSDSKTLGITILDYENIITGNNGPAVEYLNGDLIISINYSIDADGSLEIRGGTGNPGIKADNVRLESLCDHKFNIYGGTNASAVEVNNKLELKSGDIFLYGSKKSAAISELNDYENTLLLDRFYNRNNKLYAGNDENNLSLIEKYNGEKYLKFLEKKCNLTIDANEGTVNGNNQIMKKYSFSRAYRLDDYLLQKNGSAITGGRYTITDDDGVYYLSEYTLNRDGYIFSGWYKNKDNQNKIENAVNISETVRENEDKDITVYAGWFKADKGDIIVDATNDIGGRSVDLSSHDNYRAAQSDGTKYVKLNTDENQCKLPYSLYSGWNKFNSDIQKYEWTIRKYEQTFWADRDNLEEKVFTDLNGKEYYLTTKGFYRAGDKVENDSGDIKIFVPYFEAIDCVIYNLSGMNTYDSGTLIKQELVTTSQDLCVYTIDDQYIDNPDNKELIGWSLKPDASTLDYEVGEKIEVKTGDRNINLYAIWADKDGKDKTITFNDISENTGLCYAAFYNSKGKQIKTVELTPDADRKAAVKCGQKEYYRIDHIKLFTMSPDRFAPVQAVQTAVKNKDGGFDIEI